MKLSEITVDICLRTRKINIRTKFKPQSPLLLQDCCRLMPGSFTGKGIRSLHDTVRERIVGEFLKLKAPGLKPIKAQVFGEKKIRALFSESHKNVIDASNFAAFCYAVMKDGLLQWNLIYNRDSLQTASAEGAAPGMFMVHEITATLNGVFLEQSLLESGVRDMCPTTFTEMSRRSLELDLLNEGWGSLFSQSPLSFGGLLATEHYLTNVETMDPQFVELSKMALSDRHNFPALTLLKYEMAFGIDALVELMHSPGIFFSNKGDDNVLAGFYRAYKKANNTIETPSIPLNLLPNNSFLLEPVERGK